MIAFAFLLLIIWGLGTFIVGVIGLIEFIDPIDERERKTGAVRLATAPLWPIKIARLIQAALKEAGTP